MTHDHLTTCQCGSMANVPLPIERTTLFCDHCLCQGPVDQWGLGWTDGNPNPRHMKCCMCGARRVVTVA